MMKHPFDEKSIQASRTIFIRPPSDPAYSEMDAAFQAAWNSLLHSGRTLDVVYTVNEHGMVLDDNNELASELIGERFYIVKVPN